MDCFEKAMLYLAEKTLARYGVTAEIKIVKREEKEAKK